MNLHRKIVVFDYFIAKITKWILSDSCIIRLSPDQIFPPILEDDFHQEYFHQMLYLVCLETFESKKNIGLFEVFFDWIRTGAGVVYDSDLFNSRAFSLLKYSSISLHKNPVRVIDFYKDCYSALYYNKHYSEEKQMIDKGITSLRRRIYFTPSRECVSALLYVMDRWRVLSWFWSIEPIRLIDYFYGVSLPFEECKKVLDLIVDGGKKTQEFHSRISLEK